MVLVIEICLRGHVISVVCKTETRAGRPSIPATTCIVLNIRLKLIGLPTGYRVPNIKVK